jgi:transitional endoplasmic reticulum ATPase
MTADLYALRENIESSHITMEPFFLDIKDVVPSVTPEMEREYERLARQVQPEAVRIGFGGNRQGYVVSLPRAA